VSLELGGKSPNIVLEDADLETAIPGAASAIFFNHGQCCCAGSRLYVHKKHFDKVVDGVAAAAKKIKVGPGHAPDTDMGPLVSEEQLNRVMGFLKSGKVKARNRWRRRTCRQRGYFVAPTVLVNAKPGMQVMEEEISDRSCARFRSATWTTWCRPRTTTSTGSPPPSGRATCRRPTA